MAPILPGAAIGFFGGGQLGRMTAMAARSMGYDVHVVDPDPECPARPVSSRTITAGLGDEGAAARMAEGCGVVTLEIERVGAAAIRAAEALAPVRPGAEVIWIIQDRARQKEWLRAQGFPVGPFAVVDTEPACAGALASLGPIIVKTASGGYDGRGQARLERADEVPAAWRSLATDRAVAERRLSLAREISVMVARRPGGETAVYPVAMNHHDHGVLTWSLLPAPIDPAEAAAATALGREIAEAIGVVGLLAIELFVTTDGALLVNELAPRPHNTFHGSERACPAGQFEQLVRAVCDLPLGETEIVRPTAIHNLLGDEWLRALPPDVPGALVDPRVRLHLYGKRSARAGRKMGHLSAVGATPDQALHAVRDAVARLRAGAPSA